MKLTLHSILFVTAALAVALLASAWRSARNDSQQLVATLATQNATIQQATDREKQRDSQLAVVLAAIAAQKRSIHTPEQAAKHLSEVLPPLPLPVTIQTRDLVPPPASATEESPTTSLSIPQPDLVPLYDDLQDCRASTAQNEALQQDLADEKSRSSALIRERNSAVAASRGGSFLVRVKRAAKWFAIGAISGAVLAAAARH
jgi:hypothetical protein